MKTTMLEYCKTILYKVSFSKKLLMKEYRKARYWLAPHEASQLKAWLRNDLHKAMEKSPVSQ
jgi:hypothetical protein